jgi:hypothetical protein
MLSLVKEPSAAIIDAQINEIHQPQTLLVDLRFQQKPVIGHFGSQAGGRIGGIGRRQFDFRGVALGYCLKRIAIQAANGLISSRLERYGSPAYASKAEAYNRDRLSVSVFNAG